PHHRRPADAARRPPAQLVRTRRRWRPSRPLGVRDDLLDAAPERLVDDPRRRADDLDVVLDWALHLLPVHPPVLAPNFDPARAPVDQPTRVRLVLQHPLDPDRMPVPTIERRDAVADQLGADAVEAPELGEAGKYPADDLGLVRLDLALGGGRVV